MYKLSQYFSKSCENSGGNINVRLNLSSYATKANLKVVTGVDTSILAAKSDFAFLKAEVDKTDIDKLKTVPNYLIKLSDVVDNDLVKKTTNDKLTTKLNVIDTRVPGTSRLLSKIQYHFDKQNLEKNIEVVNKKIPDTSGLVKKIDCNTKITEIEKKYLLLLV